MPQQGKRLELLKDVLPRLDRVAVLAQRDHPPTVTLIEETQAAAKTLGIELQALIVCPGEIAETFRSMGKRAARRRYGAANGIIQFLYGADRRSCAQLPAANDSQAVRFLLSRTIS